jgi:hypothetical protein
MFRQCGLTGINALPGRDALTGRRVARLPDRRFRQPMVGIEKSAPSLMPDGQRAVTVLVLV